MLSLAGVPSLEGANPGGECHPGGMPTLGWVPSLAALARVPSLGRCHISRGAVKRGIL